jgi:transposase-like protein
MHIKVNNTSYCLIDVVTKEGLTVDVLVQQRNSLPVAFKNEIHTDEHLSEIYDSA